MPPQAAQNGRKRSLRGHLALRQGLCLCTPGETNEVVLVNPAESPQALLPYNGWSLDTSGYLPPRQGAYYISLSHMELDRALEALLPRKGVTKSQLSVGNVKENYFIAKINNITISQCHLLVNPYIVDHRTVSAAQIN